jgi:aminoglycoside phosphotransferase family enzyme/predicted kinase
MPSVLPGLVRSLLDSRSYPNNPDSVEFVQTHISYVFLAGDYVYKLKKPVDFGFLNFKTPQLRREACEAEVRLNRRLSPDIYLDVRPITRSGDRWRVDGDGEIVDWAVRMRRLPADRMLESLIAAGDVPDGTGGLLGEIIGRFHLSAVRGARITSIGGREAVAGNWRENFEQTSQFRGQTVTPADDDRIREYVANFLERESELLLERDNDAFIRDLHGDLRCAQIWVLEQPPGFDAELDLPERQMVAQMGNVRILDCIEFNERLRFCDTVSDLAFLAADLTYRRRAGIAADLLNRYLEVTSDTRLPLLLNFYCCYRAYVRGKVDSLGLTQREIDAKQLRRLRARAKAQFKLAMRYARPAPPPRLIVMMGLSGSGKSHLARLLALRLGAVWLSSDITRKRIVGVPAHHSAGPAAYTHQVSARTYAALHEEAERELRRGHSVILDATFMTESLRKPAARLSQRLNVPLTVVWCRAPDDLIERRIAQRDSDPFRVSDADLNVALAQRSNLQPPNELPSSSVVVAQTGGDVASLLGRLEKRLGS